MRKKVSLKQKYDWFFFLRAIDRETKYTKNIDKGIGMISSNDVRKINARLKKLNCRKHKKLYFYSFSQILFFSFNPYETRLFVETFLLACPFPVNFWNFYFLAMCS